MSDSSSNRSPLAAARTGLTRIVTSIFACLALAGCDFEVTNPGPVQDASLDDQGAHESLVNGARRQVMTGLATSAYRGGALVRDFSPNGPTGPGIPIIIEIGRLDDLNTSHTGWSRGQQGRWIAEQSAARMRENMGAAGDSYGPLGRLHLWAAYGNRSLGENFCTAVFDNGPTEPNARYFERALEHFNSAEAIARRRGTASSGWRPSRAGPPHTCIWATGLRRRRMPARFPSISSSTWRSPDGARPTSATTGSAGRSPYR